MRKLYAKRFGHYLEGNGSEEENNEGSQWWREMINVYFKKISWRKEGVREHGDRKP